MTLYNICCNLFKYTIFTIFIFKYIIKGREPSANFILVLVTHSYRGSLFSLCFLFSLRFLCIIAWYKLIEFESFFDASFSSEDKFWISQGSLQKILARILCLVFFYFIKWFYSNIIHDPYSIEINYIFNTLHF